MLSTNDDLIAAEISAADAALAPIDTKLDRYRRALAVVDARIAAIDHEERNPLRDAIARFGFEREAAQARVDLARYAALGATPAAREREYARVRDLALAAYRNAQSAYSPADKATVEAEYYALKGPLDIMHRQIGAPPGPNGVPITSDLMHATFYPRLVALEKRMTELAHGHRAPAVPQEM